MIPPQSLGLLAGREDRLWADETIRYRNVASLSPQSEQLAASHDELVEHHNSLSEELLKAEGSVPCVIAHRA